MQLFAVLVAAHLCGWAFRRIGQPKVVGEMAAGIILGPSVFGLVAPGIFARVFPATSLGYLNALAQIGLILFMFLLGVELDPRLLRGRGRTAVATSLASMALPLVLGTALGFAIFESAAPPRVTRIDFALFMGTAMCVTAFPVLARILKERRLLATEVGATAIAAAAIGDVTAWCLLALVVVLVRAGAAQHPLVLTLGGTVVYLIVMFVGVRAAARAMHTYYQKRGRLTQGLLATVLLIALASAWVTEWLGIHALFGAFVAGAVLPRDEAFVHDVLRKLEDLVVVFLLPLFFAFTGLRTQIGSIAGGGWLLCVAIIVTAIAGKWGGAALAARSTGLSWRESNVLGVLMNTRGLMELVILNVGLEIGVLTRELFAMMVLMALVTTFMTSPVLQWIGFNEKGSSRR